MNDDQVSIRDFDNLKAQVSTIEKSVTELQWHWKIIKIIASIFGLTGAALLAWAFSAATSIDKAKDVIDKAVLNGDAHIVQLVRQKQSELVPPGTIVAFAGETNIPNGWLLCDGQAISSRDTNYTALFKAVGTVWGDGSEGIGARPNSTDFNLPDLRGRFLRGVDHLANRDPNHDERTSSLKGGRAKNQVGSIQPDDYRKHTHPFPVYNTDDGQAGNPVQSHGVPPNTRSYTYEPSFAGGDETRPINAYVDFIIKY